MQTKRTLLQPEWIAAMALTVIIGAMHVQLWLHAGGLWRDEINLVNISALHSFSEMVKDAFPILMPSLVWFWMAAFGDGDLCLRLLGLLMGLALVAALWIAAWKTRRAPPLIGLVLLALNSTMFFFGDSLRAYGLGSVLAVGLTASAFVFLQKPSGLRAGWLTVFAVLSVQTLYHNAVLVAAICFGAWAVCWRRADGRAALQILLAAVVSAASLLPYLHNFISSGDAVLKTGVELPRFFATYTDTLGYPQSWYIYIWVLLYAGVVFCAVAGFRKASAPSAEKSDFTNGEMGLFAAIMLAVATAGFPLFFWHARMAMQTWYVLPLMASAAVCFDAVLPLFPGIRRAALLIFVGITAWFSIPETNAIINSHFTDADIYARQLTSAAAPDDYIIIVPWHMGITFKRYFKGTTPWDTLPPLSDHSTHRFDLVQAQLENTNAIAPVLQQIALTLHSGHRVWILAPDGYMGVPAPGTQPLPTLPLPPLKDTGWADWPYVRVWTSEIACFTADHSSQFGKLKKLSNERIIIEDMDAFRAEGWRTNAP